MEKLIRRLLLVAVVVSSFFASATVPKPGHAVFAKIITVSAFCFVLLHSKRAYGWRDTLVFVGFTVAIAFCGEWLSAGGGGAGTGLVFGHYHYTATLGPKIAGVPPLVYLAYIAMGYASITLARSILSQGGQRPKGWGLVGFAATASMVMCGWDIAMDPVSSTVNAFWVWDKGGLYFGVPLHNYLGWFVVNFLIYAAFLGYRAAAGKSEPELVGREPITWAEPIVMFASFAMVIVLPPILGKFPAGFSGLADPGLWNGTVRSVFWSASLVALWTMGLPGLVAVVRSRSSHTEPVS